MLQHLKEFYWEIKDEIGRFNYLSALIRNIPGEVGFKLRRHFIPKYFASCGENIKIHENVRYRGIHKISIGSNVEIGVDNFIQGTGGVILEDNVILGPGIKIWSVNHKFNDINTCIINQGYDYEPVIIGKGCWLAANVFVMPGSIIPEGCVVSAGSIIGKRRFPPYSILAGNPCRPIGNRNVT